MHRRRFRPPPFAPLLAVALALAACAPKTNTFAPYCPTTARLPDAQTLTLYRPGGGKDVTDLVLQGEIVNVGGVCKDGDDPNTVAVDTSVTFRFIRGPAMQDRFMDIPFLFTVTRGQDILEQARFRMRASFPSNIDSVTLTSDPIHLVFPVTKNSNAASYSVWATFQLTPEELEQNRLRGAR
ncbi:MAG: hypothetical protein JSR21_14890 [Proteobacteria bacterium]|nr:hypothetical protein [Pseudomonadota bacterium]